MDFKRQKKIKNNKPYWYLYLNSFDPETRVEGVDGLDQCCDDVGLLLLELLQNGREALTRAVFELKTTKTIYKGQFQ